MRDPRAAGRELHVATAHQGEGVGVLVSARSGSGIRVAFAVHRVPMGQLAAEDVGKDLGVAVSVRREPGQRCHPVFVKHAQGAEAGEPWILVGREREGVVAVQPAMIGASPIGGAAGNDLGVGQERSHDPALDRR